MRTATVSIVLMALLIGGNLLAGEKPDPFVGTWKTIITPDADAERAGEKIMDDTLVFADGKFASKACESRGFDAVAYEVIIRGVAVVATFIAHPVSEKEGKAEWTGDVAGSEINGKLQWTKKDGSVVKFTFKGTKE